MRFDNKPPVSDNLLKKRIQSIVADKGYHKSIADSISDLYSYMRSKRFIGGCHALSSVLYVVLSELGQNPSLYIGECEKRGIKPFDHSWICVDEKVIDLAIYMPLTMPINSVSGPVVFNVDIVTMMPTETIYGLNTGLPLSDETELVINTPFVEYMSRFPEERGGLWAVARQILSPYLQITPESLIGKYSDVTRNFLR